MIKTLYDIITNMNSEILKWDIDSANLKSEFDNRFDSIDNIIESFKSTINDKN